jgi:inorganic pyrophosphatase
MRAFIETLRNSKKRTRYNENTFVFKYKYPFDYGFIVGTNKHTDDCVDCYILSNDFLQEGKIVECEPAFMIEMFEDSEIDHKVIMTYMNYKIENIDEIIIIITTFIKKVFTQFPEVTIKFGQIIGKEETKKYIESRMK